MLPRRHSRIRVGGIYYFYSNGSFYRRYGGYYRVVHAPYGAWVSYLPVGHQVIWVNGRRVFYCDGVFYRYDPWWNVYRVIAPPYGVEVEYLPDDYEEVWYRGELFYHSRGVHYRPVYRSGFTFFLTVDL